MATQTGSIDLKGLKEAAAPAINSEQYFWHNSVDSGAGEGAGAHITQVPQDTFISDPTNGGGNLLANSDGILVREGITELASFSADNTFINKYNGNILFTCFRVGSSIEGSNVENMEHVADKTSAWTKVLPSGVVSNTQLKVQVGFRKSGSVQSGTAFFTIGTAGSVTKTYYNGDSAVISYDGNRTITVTPTFVWGDTCYGVIYYTVNTTLPSYDIGTRSGDQGGFSTIIGEGLYAEGKNQLAIGKYNLQDVNNTFAFVIGNGTDDNTRANILEVLWSGQIRLPNNASIRGYNTARTNSYQIGYISTNDRTALGNTSLPTVLQGSNGNSSGIIINYLGQFAQLFDVIDKEISVGAISAHGYQAAQDYSISVPTNYNPIGIVGYTSSNYRIRPTTYYITGGKLNIGFSNASTSAVSAGTEVHVKILCLKATSA